MATEVRTITDTWCDSCLIGDSKRVEAVFSHDISVDALSRHLDLCEKCEKKILGSLPEALEEYGAKPDPKAPRANASNEHVCPMCNAMVLSRNSLTAHARHVHGKPLSVLEVELGIQTSGRATALVDGRTELLTCEVCGKKMHGRQGMGSHLRAHRNAGETLPLAKVG